MRPRSDRYDAEIRRGATLIAEADVYAGVEDGEFIQTLPVIDGSYTIDTNASVRRRASFTLGAADLSDIVPSKDWRADTKGLWPVGNEIQLRCGVQYFDGTRELFDCGRYRLSEPKITKSVDAGVQVSVEGYDRAYSVGRSRLRNTLLVNEEQNMGDIIKALVMLNAPYLNARTDLDQIITLGAVAPFDMFVSRDDDPWALAQSIAWAFGAELFFDGSGRPVLQYFRNPLYVDVDFTYKEETDGVLLGADRSLSDSKSYSGVVLTSDSLDFAVPQTAEAWDTNRNSPTYYDPLWPDGSTFGRVPYLMTTEKINSLEVLAGAAQLLLYKTGGLTEQVDITGLVNHAHEGNDILSVEVNDMGIGSVYVADQLTIPLSPSGSMAITAKTKVVGAA